MTCIVGIAEDGHVWMGADSASADGWTVRQCRTRKMFHVGEALIGFTESWRMGQILDEHLELPDPLARIVDGGWSNLPPFVMSAAEAIRTTLQRYHYGTETHNKQEGCGLLLGYRGRLFTISYDYGVTENADRYDAIGCGDDFALGAMYACQGLPNTRITRALEAAAYMSGGVMPPFHIAVLDPDGGVGFL